MKPHFFVETSDHKTDIMGKGCFIHEIGSSINKKSPLVLANGLGDLFKKKLYGNRISFCALGNATSPRMATF